VNRVVATLAAICALAHAGARAQAASEKPAEKTPITVGRVVETVSWLASDEREGRDSPSRGLTAAGDWLAARFKAAGLEQAVPESWFHDYTLPGFRLDSHSIALTVKVTVKGEGDKDKTTVCELKPDEDVRLLRAGSVPNGADQPATVAYMGDPRVDQLLMAGAGRRPVILEVAADDWSWKSAGGERESLSQRLLGDTPVFLVRKGLLSAVPPVADADGKPNPGNDTRSSYTASWTVPVPAKVELPLRNVVAVLRGESKPDEYVMVSAHYDHLGVGRPVDGDAVYNGADDDASGTTAVVLIAEAMAKQPRPVRSVLFVCFSAEEKGLRGSAAFAKSPPVPLDRVVADVNVEMIGRPLPGKQNQAWITGPDYSDFAAIARPALQRAGIELVDFRMQDQLFAQSDNWSLAMQGVVAHSISAGSLHKDYHQPSDEVQKLDVEHMTAVIRGLLEVVRELADREQRPAYTEAGKAVLARRRR
jgi:hypothetical protein